MKKFLSLILSLTMIISIFAGMDLTVFAAELSAESTDDFDIYKYMADILSDNYKGTAFDDTPVNRKQLLCYSDPTSMSPAQLLLDSIQTNTDFVGSVAGWKLASLVSDPSSMSNETLNETEYYQMIIMKMLDELFNSEEFYKVANSEITKLSMSITDALTECMKSKYNIEFDRVCDMPLGDLLPGMKLEMMKETSDQLSKWEARNDTVGDLATILDGAQTISEYVDKMVNLGGLVKCQEDVKAVLQEMYENCPDSEVAMKAALAEVLGACTNYFTNYLVGVTEGAITIGNQLFKDVVGLMWKDVLTGISMSGGCWFLIITSVTKNLCNVFFSTDKIIEQYFKLEALCNLEYVLYKSVWTLEEKYLADETTNNAKAYLKSIDFLFKLKMIGADFCIEFADLVFNKNIIGAISNLQGENSTYTGFVNSVTYIKNRFAFMQETLLDIDYYIYYIEVDYPDVYASFCEFDSVIFPEENTEKLYFGTTVEGNNYYLYYTVDDNNEITITDYEGIHGGTIHMPDTIDGYEIRYIGDEAFKDCTGITEIVLPSTVQLIKTRAFSGCSALKTITLPKTFTCAYDYAFEGCTALETVYYNNTQEMWNSICEMFKCEGNECLYFAELITSDEEEIEKEFTYTVDQNTNTATITKYNGKGTDVIVPKRIDGYVVAAIEKDAFDGCKIIKRIILPDSITSIGHSAFSHCTNLTSITIPDSVTRIGRGAFLGTAFYKDADNWDGDILYINNHLIEAKVSINGNVSIKDGTVTIANGAFDECRNLESVTIPDGVKSIGDDAFSFCVNLTSITIPDSVVYIGEDAFFDCTSLTNITIPEGVTRISRATFYSCTSLESITILGSVTSIGDNAFYGCGSLEAVYITDIASWCQINFADSNDNPLSYAEKLYLNGELVTNLVIPDGVTSIGSYTFCYCTSLTSVVIPNGVTSIGDYAFYKCTNLTSITIPNSVISIGRSSFYKCTSLTSIAIPDGVTNIGDYTFYSCTSLEILTIRGSITSIGDEAFYGCKSLDSVYITDIASWCEMNCVDYFSNPFCYADKLYLNGEPVTTLVIPDGVTRIRDRAFRGCTSLTSVIIPSSVISIDASVFSGCTSLASITISDGVTSIGDSAFYGCTNLESITIPNSVTSIGGDAFYDCTGLKSITILGRVSRIGYCAFYGCSNLEAVYITDIANWCEIDFVYWESNPLSYAKNLYLNGELVTNLVVPDGVTSIGDYAFRSCTSIESVTIPDSVTSIGDDAFSGCGSLEAVYITDIASWCQINFADWNDNPLICAEKLYLNGELVTNLVIPDGVTSIGSYTFCDCTSLTSVVIPNSVTSIGDYAFNDCTSIDSITIPDSITTIGGWAFWDCTSLEAVYITDITSWCEIIFVDSGSNPLTYADNLYVNGKLVKNLVIPDGITGIGDYAFHGGSNFESISIPDSVTSIGDYAFCSCTSIESVTIPDGVTSIGSYTFCDCTSLTSVVIPNSVTSIGEYAFLFCKNLKSMLLPDSLTSIGENAFSGCNSFSDVWYNGDESSWGKINIGAENNSLTEATFHYETTFVGITEGDCVNGTYEIYQCSDGHQFRKEIGAALGHGETVDTYLAPTCNTNGYNKKMCLNCGEYIVNEIIPATGNHKMETTIVESTCNSEGSVTVACSYCGAIESVEYLPFSEHVPCNEPACVSPQTCIYCGIILSPVVDHIPAEDNTCSICGTNLILSGLCGEKLVWTLNKITGELSITGNGDMCEYNISEIPWYSSADSIYSVYIEEGVTGLCDYAFYNCTNLTEIDLPNSIVALSTGVFRFCNKLEHVELPNALKEIGVLAFANCSSLTDIEIPESVTVIGRSAFTSCSNLKTIEIPSKVTEIDDGTFSYCSNLEKITIPDTVKTIGNEAFCECKSLVEIAIPNNLTYLGSFAFCNCKMLTQIVIPEGIKLIDRFAFSNCQLLETVELSAGLKGVGPGAFSSCGGLKTVLYDGSSDNWNDIIIYYGNEALTNADIRCLNIKDPLEIPESESDRPLGFSYYEAYSGNYMIVSTYSGCDKDLIIPDTIDGLPVGCIYDNAFSDCDFIESVVIPNSVNTIYGGAFYGCDNLKNVVLSDSMNSITYNTFQNCASLETITICDSITSIGWDAFNGCTSLKTIYYTGTEKQWNAIIIEGGNDSLLNAEIIFLGESETPDAPVEPGIVLGDISGDGEVNAKDSNLFKRVIAGETEISKDSPEFEAVDLNGDGELNAKDSNLLKRIIAGALQL